MTKTKSLLLVSAPLVAVLALWLGHSASSVASSDVPVQARATTLIAPSHVEPIRDPVALAFEIPGRIAEIDVDEGDVVKRGQVLARLDDRIEKARVASATAAVAQTDARYQLARRGPRAEDVAAARADADAARADAEHRGVERGRTERLGALGAVATASVDADDAAAHVATATADAAQARYQSLAKGTRAEAVAESAAALAAARADLDAANVALDQTVLYAPHDGVILRRLAEVGALVTTTTAVPVVSTADLSTLELRAELDETDIAAIAVGDKAYATADAFGDRKFPVVVTRITGELGRKTVRDDDPRARIDTRVLEVIATFETPPAVPLGLRMYLHVAR